MIENGAFALTPPFIRISMLISNVLVAQKLLVSTTLRQNIVDLYLLDTDLRKLS